MLCKKEVMKQYVPWASVGEVDPKLQPNYQLTKHDTKVAFWCLITWLTLKLDLLEIFSMSKEVLVASCNLAASLQILTDFFLVGELKYSQIAWSKCPRLIDTSSLACALEVLDNLVFCLALLEFVSSLASTPRLSLSALVVVLQVLANPPPCVVA